MNTVAIAFKGQAASYGQSFAAGVHIHSNAHVNVNVQDKRNSDVNSRSEGVVGSVTLGESGNSSGLYSGNGKLVGIKGVPAVPMVVEQKAANSQIVNKNQQEVQKFEQIAEKDIEQIRHLAARDREVRQHEQAHAAAGGSYAGAPKYQFEKGPDGVAYAVGGEVPIDVAPASTPEQTIAKAQTIRRAALAPASPSPQDRKVAQASVQLEASARQEIITEKQTVDKELKAEKLEAANGVNSTHQDSATSQAKAELETAKNNASFDASLSSRKSVYDNIANLSKKSGSAQFSSSGIITSA